MKTVFKPTLLAVLVAASAPVLAHSLIADTKAPSPTTKAFAAEQRNTLPFADQEDFKLVEKGLIAQQKISKSKMRMARWFGNWVITAFYWMDSTMTASILVYSVKRN